MNFQSLQLDAAASTIFQAVFFNVGGRSPLSTQTPAFPLSQSLDFFHKQWVWFVPQGSFGLCKKSSLQGSEE